MPSDTPTRVLIVDDQEIVRKGLVMLISRQEDLVVGGGRSGGGSGDWLLQFSHESNGDVRFDWLGTSEPNSATSIFVKSNSPIAISAGVGT